MFGELEGGFVGAGGEEDVAVTTGGFGCGEGETGVGVAVGLSTWIIKLTAGVRTLDERNYLRKPTRTPIKERV